MRGLGVSENESFRPQTPSHPFSPSSLLGQNEAPLIVFAPPTEVLYPLKGELQDLNKLRGVTVSLKGWGDVMEGRSRRASFAFVFSCRSISSSTLNRNLVARHWLLKLTMVRTNDSSILHRSSNNMYKALQRCRGEIVVSNPGLSTKTSIVTHTNRNSLITPISVRRTSNKLSFSRSVSLESPA